MSDKAKRAFLHACFADAKECTHRPHTHSSARRNDGTTREGQGGREEEGEKEEPGAKDAFLYRMDAQERAK